MDDKFFCRPVWLPALLAMWVSTSTLAETASQRIFKCVDGEMTAYQSMPCNTGQTEVHVMTVARAPETQRMAVAAIPGAGTPGVAAPLPMGQSQGKMWPPRRSLMLGMSDDEVLNMPGWGVPQHIARTRAAREFREEWTYQTPAGERKLYFVNATLVDAVVDLQSSQQLAIQQIGRRAYPAT